MVLVKYLDAGFHMTLLLCATKNTDQVHKLLYFCSDLQMYRFQQKLGDKCKTPYVPPSKADKKAQKKCKKIKCGRDCTSPCGWNGNRNVCKLGETTSQVCSLCCILLFRVWSVYSINSFSFLVYCVLSNRISWFLVVTLGGVIQFCIFSLRLNNNCP